jgi:hypothetical protein
MQDAAHHIGIYNGTLEFTIYKTFNTTYISDEQLHTMEIHIYSGNKVQVEGCEDKPIFQMCQGTGIQRRR